MVKRKRLTAAELEAKLAKDPVFQAQERERDARFKAFDELLDRDERPLVEALGEVGIQVESVWDLVNTRDAYKPAIPVLIEHLAKPYHPRTKEGIARALTVKEARGTDACLVLVREFKLIDASEGPLVESLKDAIGNTLSFIADDRVLDDLLELAQDASHGDTRLFIIDALRRFRGECVIAVLESLKSDEILGEMAKKALKKVLKKVKR